MLGVKVGDAVGSCVVAEGMVVGDCEGLRVSIEGTAVGVDVGQPLVVDKEG